MSSRTLSTPSPGSSHNVAITNSRRARKLSTTALCLLLAVVFVDYCSGPDRAEMLTQLWEDIWAELWDICSSSVHLGLLTAISVC